MDENLNLKITAALETAEAANSAKELKKSMRELNALAETVGVSNAAAYNQIKQAAGECNLKVREMAASTKALTGTPMQQTAKSFGLMKESLMTMNFEQLIKSVTLFSGSLAKMNPAGLTEGFGKLGSSLATLGKTLLLNPIFLIGAAVVLIISQFDKLKEAGGAIGKVFSAIGNVIHSVIKAITDFTDALGLTDIAGEKAMHARLKNLEKEKEAVDEKYEHEVKMAELSGKSVAAAEAAKFSAQKQFAKETIAIYERIKEEKGHLTEEETEKYKEALVEYKKIQDAEAEYVALTTKKILDTETEVLKKIRQAKIENLSNETAKKKAQADFDLDETKNEIKKTNKEQAEGLEKLKLAEIAAANGNAETIQEINEKFAKAKRLIDRESNDAEVEATTKKNNEISKANEEAAKKAQEELKKKFDKELKLNADEQAIITGNIALSETERTDQLKHNLDLRNEILIRERKAKILNSDEATDEIIKNTQTEQKLDKDLAKAQEDAAKAETARILKLKNDELKAAIDIATDKKRAAITYKDQLAADVELASLSAKKKVLNDKLTVQQTLQLWVSTLAQIQKLQEQYADKEKKAHLKNLLEIDKQELDALKKSHSLKVGLENKIEDKIGKDKIAQLKAQEAEELKSVTRGSIEELAIRKKYAQLEKAVDASTAQAKIANFQAAAQKTLGIASAAAGAATALSDLVTASENANLKKGEKASLENQKKQFERHKALSMVGAVISTAQAITTQLSAGPVIGFVLAALAASSCALQIEAIAKQKFEPDSGSSGGDTSGASVPSISAPSMASSSLSNSGGSNFRAGQFYGIGTQNYNNNTGNNKQQLEVVVLESNITKAQNNVSVTQGRSTLSGVTRRH